MVLANITKINNIIRKKMFPGDIFHFSSSMTVSTFQKHYFSPDVISVFDILFLRHVAVVKF